MKLRDLQIIDSRRVGGIGTDFDRFCIQVVELYLSLIYKKIETGRIGKVVVRLVSSKELDAPREIADDISFLDWPFDFDAFDAIIKIDNRKRIVLDNIFGGLSWLAARRGWDRQLFVDAYEIALSVGIVFKGIVLDQWLKHPSLPFAANVEFEFDAAKIHLHIVIRRNDGSIVGRKYAYWTPVREDVIRLLLDRIEWVGKGKQQITTVPGRNLWGENNCTVDVGDLLATEKEGGN